MRGHRRGKWCWTLVVALASWLPHATWGDDAPPPTVEKAADQVLAAWKAKETDRLQVLAREDEPDPWLVADALLRRGESDAADAFARAAPRPDVRSLPDYLASQRRDPAADAAAWQALQKATIDRARADPAAMLALVESAPKPETVSGVRLRALRGALLDRVQRELDAVVAAHGEAGDAALRIGWLALAAEAYGRAGDVACARGDLESALRETLRALAVHRRREAAPRIMRSAGFAGALMTDLGRAAEAEPLQQEKLRLAEAAGLREDAAEALGDLGNIRYVLSDYRSAIAFQERSLATYEEIQDLRGVARTRSNLAIAYERMSDFEKARDELKRSLALAEQVGDGPVEANTLLNLANVEFDVGRYAEAADLLERALRRAQESSAPGTVSNALANLAALAERTGDFDAALRYADRALEAGKAIGMPELVASALANRAVALVGKEDWDGALDAHRRALALFEEMNARDDVAASHGDIATVLGEKGAYDEALAEYRRSLEMAESLGRTPIVITALANIASTELDRKRPSAAREPLNRAVSESRRIGDPNALVVSLAGLARLHNEEGKPAEALSAVQEALPHLEGLTGGQADVRSGLTRAYHVELFTQAIRAAAALGDVRAVFQWAERGRAGALLEALGGRDALRDAVLPPDLAAREREVRAREVAAAAAYARALPTANRAEVRRLKSDLDAARDARTAVIEAIQRTQKAAADVAYPQPAALEDVQSGLTGSEAIVLYSLLSPKTALAVVVTRTKSRIVALGDGKSVERDVEALDLPARDREIGPALDALRKRCVEPLALPDEVRTVHLSPEGALSLVPGSLLFPGRDVVHVPSATTTTWLRAQGNARGRDILALADANSPLPGLGPLPATRAEAQAVGSVVLLGADASEARLAAALPTRARWRAVHLACHGRIDDSRPGLSGLALTPDPENDGFLTALEVFRLRMPTDLAVLSACESGRGKVALGEGVLGISRSFLFAGASCVLCSLWRVDDEATSALMKRFYELWSPKDGSAGMPAAHALAMAQDYVRTLETEVPDPEETARAGHPVVRKVRRWEHPAFWAAWVLWGLAD